MICECCQGQGFTPRLTAGSLAALRGISGREPLFTGKVGSSADLIWKPCPVCNGSGISYCCDEAGANPPNAGGSWTTPPSPVRKP